MSLMEAVLYHNHFYARQVDCQIQALQVSDTANLEILTSKQVQFHLRLLREEEKVIFRQKTYAYLLHGMLAGMKKMPELVIYLPVHANERESIFKIMRGI